MRRSVCERGESADQGDVIHDSLKRCNGSDLPIQRGESAGAGLSAAGSGETVADGVAEATASLVLASTISFFSS
jgi:hypothetical protein